MDGVLVPNTELGHIILSAKHLDAEKYAASSIKDIEGISYKKWAKRLTKYYGLMEKYFNPDLIVIGGGVSASGRQVHSSHRHQDEGRAGNTAQRGWHHRCRLLCQHQAAALNRRRIGDCD